MLSKISVRKPYTVLVGVVLVLVLGFMSFRNMSTDLLPDMDLPYAIVMTTYPGASPEEIETAVTKPVAIMWLLYLRGEVTTFLCRQSTSPCRKVGMYHRNSSVTSSSLCPKGTTVQQSRH